MNRNLVCKNDIVDSVKEYNPIQLKIFYNILYVYKNEVQYAKVDKDEEICVKLEEIKKISGKKHITQDYIKEIITKMPNDIKFMKGNDFWKVGVFEYIKYCYEYGEIQFKITDKFSEILTEMLDKYTIIEMHNLSKLRSSYSIRLYELGRRYINQKHYAMKIDDFKKYFDVPRSYKMGHIDQKILTPAVKDLISKTDMTCKITKKKKGREITHIVFEFGK